MAKTIGVIIPDDMREKLEEICKEEDRNISWVVRKAIAEYIANREFYNEG